MAIPALVMIVACIFLAVGWYVTRQMDDSGGELRPAMAAYDVRHYDLDVEVSPAEKSIAGRNLVTLTATEIVEVFEIHLDDRLEVEAVRIDDLGVEFEHDEGVISAVLARPWRSGERHRVSIDYRGRPKKALRPPWIGGFVWAEGPSGASWVGVASQSDGGDIWWPCKDHPSDEPDDGMEIALTVPDGLVGLANGRPMGETINTDGSVTSVWRVGSPINSYGVSLNIGPYVPIEVPYHGVDGNLNETLVFWSLHEEVDEARRMWRKMPGVLEIFGRRFGEYPFFADKLWAVHAPYLGMEHQTLIAYGSDLTDNEFGFDWLMVHELAHEWWGNKITASDWADLWLHEGFATYAEALLVLDTLGETRYLDYMHQLRARSGANTPLIRGTDLTCNEAMWADVYVKGAWVLHTLRLLLGEEMMDEILWRFADGDNPSACRLVTTRDFTGLVEKISNRNLDWFWQRYLHTAELPFWRMSRAGGRVALAWDDPTFEMPLPVEIDGRRELVAMPGGRAELIVDANAEVLVDPGGEVLSARGVKSEG